MKLSLMFSAFAACMTYGCASRPTVPPAPANTNAITIVVDTEHCRPTSMQSMEDVGMTSLLCVVGDGKAVGVVVATSDWHNILWVK